jgi:hypothetical protein
MHECPNCGQACDCCGDDTWDDTESLMCEHDCDDDYEYDWPMGDCYDGY